MNGLFVHILGMSSSQSDELIFFRGVGQPPTRYGKMISYRKMRIFFDDFDHHPKAADLRAVKLLRSLQRAEGEADPEIMWWFLSSVPKPGVALYLLHGAMPKKIKQCFQMFPGDYRL